MAVVDARYCNRRQTQHGSAERQQFSLHCTAHQKALTLEGGSSLPCFLGSLVFMLLFAACMLFLFAKWSFFGLQGCGKCVLATATFLLFGGLTQLLLKVGCTAHSYLFKESYTACIVLLSRWHCMGHHEGAACLLQTAFRGLTEEVGNLSEWSMVVN